jgi:hypothetical protein
MRRLCTTYALVAAILMTITDGAHAQQPATHDGAYTGSMTLMETTSQAGNTEQACVAQRPVNMTIQNGGVTIYYIDWGGNTIHYRGAVDAAGGLNATHLNGDGSRSLLSGRIDGSDFTGQMEREKQMCPYRLSMSRRAA